MKINLRLTENILPSIKIISQLETEKDQFRNIISLSD